MIPIRLSDRLPPQNVMNGDAECWWWDRSDECWRIGTPMMFNEDSIFSEDNPDARYTHWLPVNVIPTPTTI